jgi:flagellar hook-associated protein 2
VSTSSTTSSGTIQFNGISQYAGDFQTLLNKAVQTAQVPINQLQVEDTGVQAQESALGSLQTDVANLATAMQTLGRDGASAALGATSSNPDAVSVSAPAATNAGSYTINSITSTASAASETSLGGVADSSNTPLDAMTLVVGNTSQTFLLNSNNLNSLVSQINSLNAGVTASVTTQNGQSYLSLASNNGAQNIALYDGPGTTGTDLVTSTGSGAETSTAGYANAASTALSTQSAPTFTFNFGNPAKPYTITLNNNNDNLVGLRDAINASGANVTASILTTANGNYLNVQANASGATTLALYAGSSATGTDLLSDSNQGSDAVFQLNGINIDQQGNTVNSVIPGVTFTLQQSSKTPVTITLSTNPSQISSDLQSFVSAYNTLQSALTAQTGQTGGALVGDTVINQLQTVMQQIASYTNTSGGVESLSDLGVTFDESGTASFDSSTFSALNSQQISAALKYIGTTTTGLGGFSGQLTQFSDPVTGLIQSEVSGLKVQDNDYQTQISTLNTQLSNMQSALTQQFETADAQQYELQQQQQTLTASLQGLSLVLYGKDPNQA